MITLEYFLSNGWVKDENGNFWKDYVTHYIELLPADGYYYPSITEIGEFASLPEQTVSLNSLNTVERLEQLISFIE